MLKSCPYAWRRCIKMGISSLKSAILYCVSTVNPIHIDPHVAALLRMTWGHSHILET